MNTERRRYFRIIDVIDLSFSVVKDVIEEQRLSSQAPTAAQLLQASDEEFGTLINAIWNGDAKLAKALSILNRKVDILAAHVGIDPDDNESSLYDHSYKEVEVSLSGCGIAFSCEEQVAKDSKLALLLALKPSSIKIEADGTVVACEENDAESDQPYIIRVDLKMKSQEEDLLIRHCVQRQVALLHKDDQDCQSDQDNQNDQDNQSDQDDLKA